jgi:hypothetical protein
MASVSELALFLIGAKAVFHEFFAQLGLNLESLDGRFIFAVGRVPG